MAICLFSVFFFFCMPCSMKGAAGGPAYERSFRWKIGQFRHLCQVLYSSKLQNCVIPLFPHKVQFCVHVYVDEVDHKFLWSNHLAKKVVSGSPGLLGFAIRPVKSVLNLPSKCPASELLLLLLLLLCCFFGGGEGGEIQMTEELYSMMLIKKYKIFTC